MHRLVTLQPAMRRLVTRRLVMVRAAVRNLNPAHTDQPGRHNPGKMHSARNVSHLLQRMTEVQVCPLRRIFFSAELSGGWSRKSSETRFPPPAIVHVLMSGLIDLISN